MPHVESAFSWGSPAWLDYVSCVWVGCCSSSQARCLSLAHFGFCQSVRRSSDYQCAGAAASRVAKVSCKYLQSCGWFSVPRAEGKTCVGGLLRRHAAVARPISVDVWLCVCAVRLLPLCACVHVSVFPDCLCTASARGVGCTFAEVVRVRSSIGCGIFCVGGGGPSYLRNACVSAVGWDAVRRRLDAAHSN